MIKKIILSIVCVSLFLILCDSELEARSRSRSRSSSRSRSISRSRSYTPKSYTSSSKARSTFANPTKKKTTSSRKRPSTTSTSSASSDSNNDFVKGALIGAGVGVVGSLAYDQITGGNETQAMEQPVQQPPTPQEPVQQPSTPQEYVQQPFTQQVQGMYQTPLQPTSTIQNVKQSEQPFITPFSAFLLSGIIFGCGGFILGRRA